MMSEGEAHQVWPVLGKKIGHSKGYVRLKSPQHPNADAEGYVYEHVYVASRVLGRALQSDEMAHHVYGDPADNRNLLICTRSYHQRLHARMSESADWPEFPPYTNSNPKPRCAVCKVTISPAAASGLCRAHYYEHLRANPSLCSVGGCSSPAGSRSGLCLEHLRHLHNKRRFNSGWDFT